MSPRRAVWVNLPNCLTLLRLLLVPPVVFYIRDGRYWLAGWLFGAAAFTDILDGLAARWTGASTRVGAYLDPIADKCCLVALIWPSPGPRRALVAGGHHLRAGHLHSGCRGGVYAFHPPPAVSPQHLG